MGHSPVVAGLHSPVVPGLGQIYAGETNKGAAAIFAAIVIANLNIIILPLIALVEPISPVGPEDPRTLWSDWIPRIGHGVASLWSIAFWLWAVVDAVLVARRRRMA